MSSAKMFARRHVRTLIGALIATALLLPQYGFKADAGGGPANKVAASAATFEVFSTDDGDPTSVEILPAAAPSPSPTATESEDENLGEDGDGAVLFTEQVKTSKPMDLVLSISLECSITTALSTTGDAAASSEGKVEVWVEIDGVAVPVTADADDPDNGKVVFCNRVYEREQRGFVDEDPADDPEREAIDTYIETRSANAFTWVAPSELVSSSGDNVHDIVVRARLLSKVRAETLGSNAQDGAADEGAAADASALAVVGKRSLLVEPVKMANDETITYLN